MIGPTPSFLPIRQAFVHLAKLLTSGGQVDF